jgi:hypothetical protein
LENPVKSPVFPLNLRKLFQKLKFWNSLDKKRSVIIMAFLKKTLPLTGE